MLFNILSILNPKLFYQTYTEEAGDMQWKGLRRILEDKHSLECGWPLGILRCYHSLPEDKDQHSGGFDMLSLKGIHCLWYIRVCRQRKDLQSSQGCIDKTQQVLSECKQRCFHKEKDCKDPLFQLLEELKISKLRCKVILSTLNNFEQTINLRVVCLLHETKGFPV